MKSGLPLATTDFSDPQQVVQQFLTACQLLRLKSGGLDANQEAENMALHSMRHYTTYKFHPYLTFAFGLNQLKHIVEINKSLNVSRIEQHIYTRSVRNMVPACLWKLQLTQGKWKISEVLRQQGPNTFYPWLPGNK